MIDAKHPQYEENIESWKKIEDVTRLKNLGDYLIKLNPLDVSEENKQRNQQYKKRAIFYAITQQTTAGMLGLLYKKEPEIDLMSGLEYLKENADGAGNSLYQQSQGLSDDIVRKSRAGLYVTFPRTEGAVSRADIQSGLTVATIHRVPAESVTNWRTITVGAKTFLSMIVMKEKSEVSQGYKHETVDQYRELFLDDSLTYGERIWRKGDRDDWIVWDEYYPRNASGSTMDRIPFTFVGGENNDPDVDHPNMLGLTELNIGHYRNSADWEDSIWYAGQPQPWMSAVSESHLDMMKEHNMYVGSRNVLGVPEGGQFGFAAAPPNPVVREAMKDKVDLMIQLGARMIQPGSVAKTAEQSGGEREIQHSVLSLIAQNISEAYVKALQWAAEYMGTDGEIDFELNQDFVDPKADPQELTAVMAGFIQGSMPQSDYVAYMKKRGLFEEGKPEEDYAEELERGPTMPDFNA